MNSAFFKGFEGLFLTIEIGMAASVHTQSPIGPIKEVTYWKKSILTEIGQLLESFFIGAFSLSYGALLDSEATAMAFLARPKDGTYLFEGHGFLSQAFGWNWAGGTCIGLPNGIGTYCAKKVQICSGVPGDPFAQERT